MHIHRWFFKLELKKPAATSWRYLLVNVFHVETLKLEPVYIQFCFILNFWYAIAPFVTCHVASSVHTSLKGHAMVDHQSTHPASGSQNILNHLCKLDMGTALCSSQIYGGCSRKHNNAFVSSFITIHVDTYR